MDHDLITHYGRVRVAYPKVGVPTESLFSQVTRYTNHLSQQVAMRLRSGLLVTFPVMQGQQRERSQNGEFEFVISREYVFQRTSFLDAANFFAGVTEQHSLELQALRDIYLKHYKEVNPSQREIRCMFEHYFTEDELKRLGGQFYHHEMDAVFSLGRAIPFEHPHSSEGQAIAAKDSANHVADQYGFVFTVEIIDATSKYGERYVCICGQVYKIVPKHGVNKPDGIYIVSSSPTVGKMTTNEIVIETYAFGEAEKQLGLFHSYEEALANGDQALARKRELEDLQHKHKLEANEMQMDKLKHDREVQERDRKIKDLEHERTLRQRELEMRDQELNNIRTRIDHTIEMEKLRLKEMYEKRSFDRKESFELMKYLPIIITAIGTVLMTIKTFKTTSTK
jgi:hypothetical protein